jgi:protein tyrosine phosphatase (PTP) superfamily phosphohydrolase (DUF442 family)
MEAKILSSEKRKMWLIFSYHVYLLWCSFFKLLSPQPFGAFSPRVTLVASNPMMRRTCLSLALFCLSPAPLLAQDAGRAAATPASSVLAPPAYGEKLHIQGIHNSGKVSDVLYRGAQPKERGLAELKKLGISVIVDLRGEDKTRINWERSQAESLGMRFVHIPVSGWSPPTDEQVALFLSLFRGDTAQKIFVHCRFGDDRTGVFVATYRMALEKWSAELAIKEMYFFGFNGFWHPAMKSFIREFPERLKVSPSLASFQPPQPHS